MTPNGYIPDVLSIVLDTPSEKHAKALVEFIKTNFPANAIQDRYTVQIRFRVTVKPEHLSQILNKISSFTLPAFRNINQ